MTKLEKLEAVIAAAAAANYGVYVAELNKQEAENSND